MHLDGPAAPPMANGELVFEAPWQSRVFGMANSLCDAGLFDWDAFREQLIAEIAAFDRDHAGEPFHYYDHFLAALTRLLGSRGFCANEELAERVAALAVRPHGHDH